MKKVLVILQPSLKENLSALYSEAKKKHMFVILVFVIFRINILSTEKDKGKAKISL